MCAYSMICDHFYDKWAPSGPIITPPAIPRPRPTPLTDEEIEEFRKLLERAKKYDIDNGEPECELEDKKRKLKELARQLGKELEEVLG